MIIILSSCIGTNEMKEKIAPEYITTRVSDSGIPVQIEFETGKSHNHPLMVFWVEDTSGKFIETIFVAESIGKGYFDYGDSSTGKWLPGKIIRPASLPYWAHKRGVKTGNSYMPTYENPIPDAYTGATPKGDFKIKSKINTDNTVFYIYMEINQPWDWNEFWTNNKYPDDMEYKTSSQPALIYRAKVDINKSSQVDFELIGHSSYNGSNGNLYKDLSTITTAKKIVESLKVTLNPYR